MPFLSTKIEIIVNARGTADERPVTKSHFGDWQWQASHECGAFGGTSRSNFCCSAVGCNENGVHGAHVYIVSNSYDYNQYIVPLCPKHNKYSGYICVKPEIYFADAARNENEFEGAFRNFPVRFSNDISNDEKGAFSF